MHRPALFPSFSLYVDFLTISFCLCSTIECRIAACVMCAQLKQEMAAELSKVRQLGLGVPGGVEIAYRTVELALERLMDDAGGDLDRFGVALAYDLKSAYNNVRRAHMINESMLKYPQMTRFLNLLYGSPGKLIFSANGREIDSFWCYDGVFQGCPPWAARALFGDVAVL